MRKIYALIFASCIAIPAIAQQSYDFILNTITLQLKAEQWLTTKTALVNIRINAAVSGQGIERIQQNVMQKLNQISDKGEWHLISFERQLDKSELESIQIMAEARLPQTELSNLRTKAKNLSKPGEFYNIDTIQFTPSNEETRQGSLQLRNNLYNQAKAEIEQLNKIYSDQKYYLHQINFIDQVTPMPMMQAQAAGFSAKNVAATPALSVGNKQELLATVVIAAIPEPLIKIIATKNSSL